MAAITYKKNLVVTVIVPSLTLGTRDEVVHKMTEQFAHTDLRFELRPDPVVVLISESDLEDVDELLPPSKACQARSKCVLKSSTILA